MKTIYGRLNEIEERLHLAGGGNQGVIEIVKNGNDTIPLRVDRYPSDKPYHFRIIMGGGFVPPDLSNDMALPTV